MKKIWKRIMSVLLSVALTLSLTAPAFAAYRDVPASHWAADDIQYVTERRLFNGTGPDAFGPSTEMSRAMLATVLYRYAGSPAVNEAVPYVDVTTETWYMPGVAWAYQNRIFASVNLSRTLLYPDEDVRRAEFCIMLYNFAKTLGRAASDPDAVARAPFTDMDWNRFSMAGFGPIYNEAKDAMLSWAWPTRIMEGTSATTINPLGTITRAEVAAMLARFDRNVLGGTEPTAQPTLSPEPNPMRAPSDTPAPAISEESVQAALADLKTVYPTGTIYPTPYRSTSNGPYRRGIHCSGWATLCSDAAFGNLPWRSIDRPTWDQIRPGDIVEYRTENEYHAVIVVSKTDSYVKVTESSVNNMVRWGGQYFKWWLEEQPHYLLYTRYPE